MNSTKKIKKRSGMLLGADPSLDESIVTLLDTQTKPIYPYTVFDAIGELEGKTFKAPVLKSAAKRDASDFVGTIADSSTTDIENVIIEIAEGAAEDGNPKKLTVKKASISSLIKVLEENGISGLDVETFKEFITKDGSAVIKTEGNSGGGNVVTGVTLTTNGSGQIVLKVTKGTVTSGSDGAAGAQGPPGPPGPKGDPGTGITIKGTKNSKDELPGSGNTAGDSYLINGNLWIWDGSDWVDGGNIKGPKGDDGRDGEDGEDGEDGSQVEVRGGTLYIDGVPQDLNTGGGSSSGVSLPSNFIKLNNCNEEDGKYISGLSLMGNNTAGWTIAASKATDQKGSSSGGSVVETFTGLKANSTNVNPSGGRITIKGSQNVTVSGSGSTITVTGPNLSSYATTTYVDNKVKGAGGSVTETFTGLQANGTNVNPSSGRINIKGSQNVTVSGSGSTITVTGPNLSSYATTIYVDNKVKSAGGSQNLQQVCDKGYKTTTRIEAAGGFYETSDSRLKTITSHIDTDTAVDFVKSIHPVNYIWKDDAEQKNNVGLIAQDVEIFFPELVNTNEDGYKSIDYAKVVSVLIPVMKDMLDRIEKLEKK